MGSTYSNIGCHIVFATRYRQPWIADSWRARLHGYIGGALSGLQTNPIAIGGTTDHVHILIQYKPTVAIANVVREVKKASTQWVREEIPLPPFGWQEGYAVFSSSPGSLDTPVAYIQNQEEHHRTCSPLDEFERLLKESGVSYDPKYLE